MDYEKKYYQLINGWDSIQDISELYPDCNAFEKCVISMRLEGWSYATIQKRLGMPSKKEISAVLKKWAPELMDIDLKKYREDLLWKTM